jgi:hypothetical protein
LRGGRGRRRQLSFARVESGRLGRIGHRPAAEVGRQGGDRRRLGLLRRADVPAQVRQPGPGARERLLGRSLIVAQCGGDRALLLQGVAAALPGRGLLGQGRSQGVHDRRLVIVGQLRHFQRVQHLRGVAGGEQRVGGVGHRAVVLLVGVDEQLDELRVGLVVVTLGLLLHLLGGAHLRSRVALGEHLRGVALTGAVGGGRQGRQLAGLLLDPGGEVGDGAVGRGLLPLGLGQRGRVRRRRGGRNRGRGGGSGQQGDGGQRGAHQRSRSNAASERQHESPSGMASF